MSQNRLAGESGVHRYYFGEGEASAYLRPTPREAAPAGFAPCPMVGMVWPHLIYWMAMEQARAVVKPSWTELALSPQLN